MSELKYIYIYIYSESKFQFYLLLIIDHFSNYKIIYEKKKLSLALLEVTKNWDRGLLKVLPILNRCVSAHWLRDTEGDGAAHKPLPRTKNSLASADVNSKNKRVKTGNIILKEAIDSSTGSHTNELTSNSI